MKNNIIVLLILAGLQASCSEDPFTLFDSAKNNAIKIITTDKLVSNFGNVDADQDTDTLFFDVELVGVPTDYDRYFKLVVVDSLTTAEEGVHYEPLKEQLLPAGQYNAVATLVTKRSDDYKDKRFTIVLDVAKSEDFDGYMSGFGGLEIEIYEVNEPYWWTAVPGFPYDVVKYWGRFHPKKLELIYYFYNVADENQADWVPPIGQDPGKFFACMAYLKNYFDKNPTYHDDGERVTIP